MRGHAVESRHIVLGACVGAGPRLPGLPPAGATPPLTAFFMRSAAKPFQLLPLVARGGETAFCLDEIDLALLASSHDGTPAQADRVRAILARAGFDEAALRCGTHRPYFLDRRPPDDVARLRTYGPAHHNCSGNHAAMLAHARLCGVDAAAYLDPENAAQQQIAAVFEALAGAAPEVVTDNCSGPCYRLTPVQVAVLFGFLATPARLRALPAAARDLLERIAPLPQVEAGLERISVAMAHHPDWLTSPGHPDTRLAACAPGELVVKRGAEGVLCLAHRQRDAALVLKVVDGNRRALTPAAVHAMRALGWLAGAADPDLESPRLVGDSGAVVGYLAVSAASASIQALP